jgi:hypothetical protein
VIATATTSSHAKLPQDDFQGTKLRKRGLQQVKTHKRRKPQPIGIVIVRERQTGQNERACKSSNDHFHKFVLVFVD